MKQYIFHILILISISFYTCKKEPIQPENKFNFKYSFFNNGDTSLKRVILNCITVYPIENTTSLITRGKWRDTECYDKNYLWDFDSLIIETDMKVYPSCFFRYDISLEFLDSEGKGYLKNFSRIDTIRSKNDINVKFSWPEDSLLFEKIN